MNSGDALERLREEQQQIGELFETFARNQRDPDYQTVEAVRLSGLICTLLRVHDELQSAVLQPALQAELGNHPALARSQARRDGVLDAVERLEAISPRHPGFGRQMSALARQAQAWFEGDEADMFGLARDSQLDLQMLDQQLGQRQEALLSAGR